jgi:hypothetical protein
MTDRLVRYILEMDYEGVSATLKAAEGLREVDDAARGAREGLERSEGGFSKVQASIVTLNSALGIAQTAFGAVQNVVGGVWSALEEGAAVQDAQEDFDALATSVGTTASAMLNDMGAAAGGMLSNAEMIGAASDLMLLNLGLTEQQIVDLVGVAGELEWSMDALANTLNTKSSRGLKELGLGIEDVEGRVDELTAAGYSLDEAFTLAILEAGRERIELVGGASETAAGKMVIATNAVEDYTSALKVQAVQLADNIGLFDALAGAAEGMNAFIEAADALDEALRRGVITRQEYNELNAMIRRGGVEIAQAVREELVGAWEEEARALQWVVDQYDAYYAAQELAAVGTQMSADAVEDGLALWGQVVEGQEAVAAAAALAAEDGFYLADAFAALAVAAEEYAAKQELANNAASAWAEYTAELTAQGGDYFTQFSQADDDIWNLGEAIYNAADAAGAGVGPLGDLAVQYGLLDQASVDAATSQAQQQVIIDSLAGAAASGQIAWDDYVGAVERAVEVLNGAYLVDLGPREMPEMEDRGFREGFQEQLTQVANELEPIPLEVELRNDLIQQAVDTAKGIVEGFTNPAEVYEAVMEMDITDVETKTTRATELINGIPSNRSVNIDISVTGMELLEELRTLGVIP